MALIKCKECGKMFSEYAECCPQCGCPTFQSLSDQQDSTAAPITELQQPSVAEHVVITTPGVEDPKPEVYIVEDPTPELTQSPDTTPTPEPAPIPKESKKNKKLIWSIFSVVVVLACISIFFFTNHATQDSSDIPNDIQDTLVAYYANNEVFESDENFPGSDLCKRVYNIQAQLFNGNYDCLSKSLKERRDKNYEILGNYGEQFSFGNFWGGEADFKTINAFRVLSQTPSSVWAIASFSYGHWGSDDEDSFIILNSYFNLVYEDSQWMLDNCISSDEEGLTCLPSDNNTNRYGARKHYSEEKIQERYTKMLDFFENEVCKVPWTNEYNESIKLEFKPNNIVWDGTDRKDYKYIIKGGSVVLQNNAGKVVRRYTWEEDYMGNQFLQSDQNSFVRAEY